MMILTEVQNSAVIAEAWVEIALQGVHTFGQEERSLRRDETLQGRHV